MNEFRRFPRRWPEDRLDSARERSAEAALTPKNPAMRALLATLARLGGSDLTPVLLEGATGAGKRYSAEALHRLTHPPLGTDAPFVDVPCGAIAPDQIENALFGAERGVLASARTSQRGLIELAHRGTLFLDEVSALPPAVQVKLLGFLDTSRIRRLGADREMEVRTRVVAATRLDLGGCVRAGRFREDLYRRFSMFALRVPPLAQRPEEIADLAQLFRERCARRLKKPVTGFSEEALAALVRYAFPGNVRELQNIIERAVILCAGASIDESDLLLPGATANAAAPSFFSVDLPAGAPPPPVEHVERAYVLRVLEYFEGRRMAAAKGLGLSYPTFLKRLRELGVDRG
ncbi:MAG TPA: sigma 54-interacting transcriptional regulator [Polyangiaceae bacterium]|nr:sigma 54-interacting transcriptional regulator [Polyangiaceae bacterium]